MIRCARACVVAIAAAAPSLSRAQSGPPDLEWSLVTGGGSLILTGGAAAYQMSCSVGQAGAGVLTGDDFEFAAGFWFGVLPSAFCYANCDESSTPPLLNVNDFACFLNRFAAGDPYANCDGSSAPPVLNVNDFQCFINSFAVGCP